MPIHKLRDECLNLHWFRSLRLAREEIERWRHHHNTERPHSALAYRTPMEVFATNAATALEPRAGSTLSLIAQPNPGDSSSARPQNAGKGQIPAAVPAPQNRPRTVGTGR
jgi:putative transposase